MSTKHTPGPWRVHPTNKERVIQSSQDIASMSGIFRDTVERESNARLIAAAPELLAVLQQAHKTLTERCMEDGSMDWVSPGQTLLERIANAIEDATGTRPEEF